MQKYFFALLFPLALGALGCGSSQGATETATPTTKSGTSTGSAADWQNQTPEQRAAAQTERLTERLDLTAKQTEQIGAINLRYAQQRGANRGQGGGDRRAALQQMREQIQRQDAEIEAVLTTEQKAEYGKYKEERRAEMRQRMQQRGGQGGGRRGF